MGKDNMVIFTMISSFAEGRLLLVLSFKYLTCEQVLRQELNGCIKIRVSGDCETDFLRFYSQPLPLQIHVQHTFLNMNSLDIHISLQPFCHAWTHRETPQPPAGTFQTARLGG